MINRAKQSWPKELTINLVHHRKELKPFGRLRAMQMLLEKTAVEVPERSPYRHELNKEGTACAEDCPACRWAAENVKQQA